MLIVPLATSTGAYNATAAIIDAHARGAFVHVAEVEKFFIHILHMMLGWITEVRGVHKAVETH